MREALFTSVTTSIPSTFRIMKQSGSQNDRSVVPLIQHPFRIPLGPLWTWSWFEFSIRDGIVKMHVLLAHRQIMTGCVSCKQRDDLTLLKASPYEMQSGT
jgi:hypothetical protein